MSDGQPEGAVARPGGGQAVGRGQQVGGGTHVHSTAQVGHVLQTEELPLLSEASLLQLGPQVGGGRRIGVSPALNLHTAALIHLLQLLQADPRPVQDADVEAGPGDLAEVVVGLAGVEALVLPADGGDDVSEGGGDVPPAQGPLDTGDLGVGVHLKH